MPFICQIRTDIPEGTLQVLDLRPNTSQRSLIYEPPPQTKYLRRASNDTVALSGTDTLATYNGVAAYLIDNVIDGVSGVTITPAVANAGADGLLAILDAGGDLDLASVNADLIATGGAGAGTDLTGGGSTGTLAGLLAVMAGADYVLPAGSTVGALAAGAELGAQGPYRATYSHGALNISLGEGDLAAMTSADFSYGGTAGAAVSVLADDGTVL